MRSPPLLLYHGLPARLGPGLPHKRDAYATMVPTGAGYAVVLGPLFPSWPSSLRLLGSGDADGAIPRTGRGGLCLPLLPAVEGPMFPLAGFAGTLPPSAERSIHPKPQRASKNERTAQLSELLRVISNNRARRADRRKKATNEAQTTHSYRGMRSRTGHDFNRQSE